MIWWRVKQTFNNSSVIRKFSIASVNLYGGRDWLNVLQLPLHFKFLNTGCIKSFLYYIYYSPVQLLEVVTILVSSVIVIYCTVLWILQNELLELNYRYTRKVYFLPINLMLTFRKDENSCHRSISQSSTHYHITLKFIFNQLAHDVELTT